MRTLISAAVAVLASVAIIVPVQAQDTSAPFNETLKRCRGEFPARGSDCYWDNRHDGGHAGGISFVMGHHGWTYQVPHWVAHQLRYDNEAPPIPDC